MYRSTRAVKKTDIAKIAKRIEVNESLKQGKMPELVPSWLILQAETLSYASIVSNINR